MLPDRSCLDQNPIGYSQSDQSQSFPQRCICGLQSNPYTSGSYGQHGERKPRSSRCCLCGGVVMVSTSWSTHTPQISDITGQQVPYRMQGVAAYGLVSPFSYGSAIWSLTAVLLGKSRYRWLCWRGRSSNSARISKRTGNPSC